MQIRTLNPVLNPSSQRGFTKSLEREHGKVIIKKINKKTRRVVSKLIIFRNGNKQYVEHNSSGIARKVDFFDGGRSYRIKNPNASSAADRFLEIERLEKMPHNFLNLDWVTFLFDTKGKQIGHRKVKNLF